MNTEAKVGDEIWLTKPLGTGIVTTAAKFDSCSAAELAAAISSMATLNMQACQAGLAVGVRCATDITGFGLAGHLYNVAKASGLTLEIDCMALPLLPGVRRMIEEGHTTGGGAKNAAFIGEALAFGEAVEPWMRHLVVDPQTSGGLALFSRTSPGVGVRIGRVAAGPAKVLFQ